MCVHVRLRVCVCLSAYMHVRFVHVFTVYTFYKQVFVWLYAFVYVCFTQIFMCVCLLQAVQSIGLLFEFISI